MSPKGVRWVGSTTAEDQWTISSRIIYFLLRGFDLAPVIRRDTDRTTTYQPEEKRFTTAWRISVLSDTRTSFLPFSETLKEVDSRSIYPREEWTIIRNYLLGRCASINKAIEFFSIVRNSDDFVDDYSAPDDSSFLVPCKRCLLSRSTTTRLRPLSSCETIAWKRTPDRRISDSRPYTIARVRKPGGKSAVAPSLIYRHQRS